MHTYRESIYLGDCGKDLPEVQAILDHMKSSWMGPTYDLLRKNCCSFSDAFAQALGVGPIPKWVHHLADVGATLDDDVKAVVHGLHFVEDKVKGVAWLCITRCTRRTRRRPRGLQGHEPRRWGGATNSLLLNRHRRAPM